MRLQNCIMLYQLLITRFSQDTYKDKILTFDFALPCSIFPDPMPHIVAEGV
jgi:hypothetical protein